MKTLGILLLGFGILSLIVAIVATIKGIYAPFEGVGFIVLGAFLINRENKKIEEKRRKKEWEENNKL